MLTPPAIAPEYIAARLGERYGLRVARVAFLPIGDAGSAHYRVEAADGAAYFLKLRGRDFDAVGVLVPAWLHAQGVAHVMAPLATVTGHFWLEEQGFGWVLYPFMQGTNGFAVPLSRAQWRALGEGLAAVHACVLSPELAARVPREDYGPRWRDIVRAYQARVETREEDDAIAARFAVWWRARRQDITTVVERAEALGQALRGRGDAFVLCHTDVHAGNVLLGADDALAIVDWDAPLQAPKERDLMFMGGGVGDIWNTPQEEEQFYTGYGSATVDLVALSYHRYERIVEDLATFGEQVFEVQGSEEDRAWALEKCEPFLPGGVAEIAHATYRRLNAE